MAASKVCAAPGCPTLTQQVRCDLHARQYARGRTGRPYRRARAAVLTGTPPCWYCGAPAVTADHAVPLAAGGDPYDLRPACAPCNRERGASGDEDADEENPGG